MGSGPLDSDKGNLDKDADKDSANNGADQDGTDTGTDDADKDKNADKDDKTKDDTSGLKSALRKERQAREAAEKQLRDAELAKLPELDRLKTENSELVKVNEKLTKENLRLKIGAELGLPYRLTKRIDGDDEEAMRADAADLLKDFKADDKDDDKDSKRPPNDAKKTGRTGSGRTMNDLMRAAAGKSKR